MKRKIKFLYGSFPCPNVSANNYCIVTFAMQRNGPGTQAARNNDISYLTS